MAVPLALVKRFRLWTAIAVFAVIGSDGRPRCDTRSRDDNAAMQPFIGWRGRAASLTSERNG